MVIEFPIAQYDAFVEKCRQELTDYEILKRAAMVRHKRKGHFERTMRIDCAIDEALTLRALAVRLYPDVVPIIEQSLRIAQGKRR